MSLFEDWVRNETRRQFFSRGANAVGWAALASLLGGERSGALAATAETGATESDPFCTQGQACDLFAHGRRARANGLVRLQADHAGMVRQGLARDDPQRPASDDDDVGPGPVSDRAVEV